MSKKTVKLLIEVSEGDAFDILFNDSHGNTQWVADSGSSYPILSADTLEDYLESLEEA